MNDHKWLWQAAKSLVFFLQLGLSIVLPVALCVWGAVYLQQNCGWGGWTTVAGIVLGLVLAGYSFRDFARYMRREARKTNGPPKPPNRPVPPQQH